MEDREAEFAQLSQAELYWYKELFPAWFNEADPKLPNWKKKLMADEFEGQDTAFIKRVCLEIENCGGNTLNPYIADLSMATDLIACGIKGLVLCVQLTTVRDSLGFSKQSDWESTLKYWQIKRGLFVSFNPSQAQISAKIGECVVRNSDQLPVNGCYHILTIDL